MTEETGTIKTIVAASEDGKHTFEIQKILEGVKGKSAIVIELYPTLKASNIYRTDLSMMHLTNHLQELGWNRVRILNLFSEVFDGKPLASRLKFDVENLAFFEDILEGEDMAGYDIVIAWGTTLENHKEAKEMKLEFLKILEQKGLEGQVRQLAVDTLETAKQICPHPLFLGLRHARERWRLEKFPLQKVLKELEAKKPKKAQKQTEKKKQEKTSAGEKKGTPSVPDGKVIRNPTGSDKKQAGEMNEKGETKDDEK